MDPELSHEEDLTGLVRRFSAGQTELFGEIVHGHCYKKMVKLATRMINRCQIRDPAYEGEDAVGEAEAKLWRAAIDGKLPPIPDGEGFRGLFRWALRGVILHKREQLATSKRGGSQICRVVERLDDLHSPQPTPAELACAHLECQALLAELNDPVLETIAQKRIDGYSNPEIAQHLQRPVCFVERRVRSIRSAWEVAYATLASG